MAKRLDYNAIVSTKENTLQEAKRKKGGRPPKEGQKATQKLTIYLTPDEEAMLNAYSENSGIPKATVAKRALLKILQNT